MANATVPPAPAFSLPGGGAAKRVDFAVPTDSIGELNYGFVLTSDLPEKLVRNNRRSTAVTVLKDRLNILLVGERPGWEFAFLRRTLGSNDKYQVSAYLPGGGAKKILLPEQEQLDRYDCVILVGCGEAAFARYGTTDLFCLMKSAWRSSAMRRIPWRSPERAPGRFSSQIDSAMCSESMIRLSRIQALSEAKDV